MYKNKNKFDLCCYRWTITCHLQGPAALAGTREQHSLEISRLEDLVSATQDMVRKQTKKYTDQLDKLAVSDRIIRQLVAENDQLAFAIQSLQEQCRTGAEVRVVEG